ncbi:MAG: hypothetical protein ABH842_03145 [Candidatus Micrarchaeota archaeon]
MRLHRSNIQTRPTGAEAKRSSTFTKVALGAGALVVLAGCGDPKPVIQPIIPGATSVAGSSYSCDIDKAEVSHDSVCVSSCSFGNNNGPFDFTQHPVLKVDCSEGGTYHIFVFTSREFSPWWAEPPKFAGKTAPKEPSLLWEGIGNKKERFFAAEVQVKGFTVRSAVLTRAEIVCKNRVVMTLGPDNLDKLETVCDGKGGVGTKYRSKEPDVSYVWFVRSDVTGEAAKQLWLQKVAEFFPK